MRKLLKYISEYYKEMIGEIMKPENGRGIGFIVILILIYVLLNPNEIEFGYKEILELTAGVVIFSGGYFGIRNLRKNRVVYGMITLLIGFTLILLGLGFLNV